MEDSKLENILRKLAIILGAVLLAASVQLSYDGFDQSVSGSNPDYQLLAIGIGYALAITFNVLEFIVSSRSENLNNTLKVVGLFAYGYSIYTNFLGAQALLGTDKVMSAIIAVFMDIVPEPMIAWGLGEAIMHDLFGNFGKFMTEPSGKKKGGGQQNQNQKQGGQNQGQRQPQFKGNSGGGYPHDSPKGGGSERRAQLEREHYAAKSDDGDTGQFRVITRH